MWGAGKLEKERGRRKIRGDDIDLTAHWLGMWKNVQSVTLSQGGRETALISKEGGADVELEVSVRSA